MDLPKVIYAKMYEDITTDTGIPKSEFFLIASEGKKELVLDPDGEEGEVIEIGEYHLVKKEEVKTKHKEFVKV